MRLPRIKNDVFQQLVEFSYSEENSQIKCLPAAEELPIATDVFYCVDLKLRDESSITREFLRAENATMMILFGGAHSCAILK